MNAGFTNKSEYFVVLTAMLPNHYFEKPLIVRIIWELWIAIREVNTSAQSDIVDKLAIEFGQRMNLLQKGVSL